MSSNERSKQEKSITAQNVIFTLLRQIAQKEWLKIIVLHRFMSHTQTIFDALYNKVCKARMNMYHIVKFQTFARRWLCRTRAARHSHCHAAPTLGLVKNSLSLLAALIKRRLAQNNRKTLGRIFPEFVRLDRLKILLDKLYFSRLTLLYRMKAHYRNYSVKYMEFSREFDRDLYEILSWEESYNKRRSKGKGKFNYGTKLLDNLQRFGEEYKRKLFKIVYNVRLMNYLTQVSGEAERMAGERNANAVVFQQDPGRSKQSLGGDDSPIRKKVNQFMEGIASGDYPTERSGVSVARGKHVLEFPRSGFNVLPVDSQSSDSDRCVSLNGKNSQK